MAETKKGIDGYIISAWSKSGELVLGRCQEPKLSLYDGLVMGWIVEDTARLLGRAAFGDQFSKPGPSCVYGMHWEDYPGASAVGDLSRCAWQGSKKSALADPKAAVEAAIAGPETPLCYEYARQVLQIAESATDGYKLLLDNAEQLKRKGL